MALYKGSQKIGAIYKGSQKIGKIYKGTQLVFSSGRLPSGYTLKEYIQSTGTQYIDTGVKPYKTMCEIEFAFTSNSNGWVAASFTAGNNRYLPVGLVSNNILAAKKDNTQVILSAYDTNKHKVVYNDSSNLVFIDNVAKGTVSDLDTADTQSVYLFCYHTGAGAAQFANARIYSCKFTDKTTGKLIRNFVPVVRNADGKVGMYDLVTNQFYTNAGTGEFLTN